ncbi:unnamed protein product [Urochloa humidicola]
MTKPCYYHLPQPLTSPVSPTLTAKNRTNQQPRLHGSLPFPAPLLPSDLAPNPHNKLHADLTFPCKRAARRPLASSSPSIHETMTRPRRAHGSPAEPNPACFFSTSPTHRVASRPSPPALAPYKPRPSPPVASPLSSSLSRSATRYTPKNLTRSSGPARSPRRRAGESGRSLTPVQPRGAEVPAPYPVVAQICLRFSPRRGAIPPRLGERAPLSPPDPMRTAPFHGGSGGSVSRSGRLPPLLGPIWVDSMRSGLLCSASGHRGRNSPGSRGVMWRKCQICARAYGRGSAWL